MDARCAAAFTPTRRAGPRHSLCSHALPTSRRYYRVDDCHEYAQQYHGLKGPVQWDDRTLDAMPKELFFSLHPDENHADCILRTCTVLFHREDFEPQAR